MVSGLWDIDTGHRPIDPSFEQGLRRLAQEWESRAEGFWSADEILLSLRRPEVRVYYAVAHGSLSASDSGIPRWQGFLLAEVGMFSTELLYIYVQKEARRSGLGRELLERLMADLQKLSGQEALFLEVRASNAPAQHLYRRLGLQKVGQRRHYYANGEDAFVFKYDFKPRLS